MILLPALQALGTFPLAELFGTSWVDQPIEFRYDGGQPAPGTARMIGPAGTEVPFQWVSSCSDSTAVKGCIVVRSNLPAGANYKWTLQTGAPQAVPVKPVQIAQVGSNWGNQLPADWHSHRHSGRQRCAVESGAGTGHLNRQWHMDRRRQRAELPLYRNQSEWLCGQRRRPAYHQGLYGHRLQRHGHRFGTDENRNQGHLYVQPAAICGRVYRHQCGWPRALHHHRDDVREFEVDSHR